MDFLRNHAHLAGGDTSHARHPKTRNFARKAPKFSHAHLARKAPKNTQFSKSRHTPRGQGSPPRQPLPIHQITAKPLNPF